MRWLLGSKLFSQDSSGSRLLSKKSYISSGYSRGFTLFELLVVFIIFSTVTGIIIANYRDFGKSIRLSNLAQDIALTIRQAKVFATSASEYTGSERRGIYFPYISGGYDNQFFLFADSDLGSIGTYDVSDIVLDTVRITGDDRILDICGGPMSNPGQVCSTGGDLNIIFTRAEHNALLNLDGTSYEAVQIVVGSSMSYSRRIVVLVTGRITVE